MFYIVICILLYFAVTLFDMVPLAKNGEKKVLFLYIPVFLSTLAVNILYGLDFRIPSPAEPVKELIGLIFGAK